MQRMAVFVEGQTERIFVERLIKELAGKRDVQIDAVRAYGGSGSISRHWVEINATRPSWSTSYYILIYESMGDSKVLSDIREQYKTLMNERYNSIIGLRDVYPLHVSDIPTIREDFELLRPTGAVTPELILEVMEIEAWFIAEHSHFSRLSHELNHETVSSELGYDPITHDMTTVHQPSIGLRAVYNKAGKGYNKSKKHATRTTDKLCYEQIYMAIRNRFTDLDRLITLIEHFFGLTEASSLTDHDLHR